MATKEEVEGKLESLREEHEKLKMRYKEASTKLQIARFALQAQSDVLDEHLRLAEPVGYEGDKGRVTNIIRKEN